MQKKKRNILALSSNLWQSYIPLKWAIIGWRIVQNKLPFDENLQHMGFQLAFRCVCCDTLCCSENLDHVFAQNPTATRLWNFVEAKIHSSSSLISLKLNEWWVVKVNSPCHKAMLSLIPLGVCWEL